MSMPFWKCQSHAFGVHRLYRDHVFKIFGDGVYKDLERLGRDMSKVICVDY